MMRQIEMLSVKRKIVAQVSAQLELELSAMTRAARAAHDAATHEEAKPENDKDTRSVEAAYLAGAQAARAAELQSTLSTLQNLELPDYAAGTPLASGALARLRSEEDNQEREYLLLPVAGGARIEVDGRRYHTTTLSSPLGAVLAGSLLGDDLEFESPSGTKHFEIVGLA